MPVTSRTPVRPPPARARTHSGPPRPDPRGRCANPAAGGGPASRRARRRQRGSAPRLPWITWATGGGWIGGGGGAGSSPPLLARAGEKTPPTPSSSASPFKFAGPGRRDPGMALAARPALRPFFPAAAQKFRSRTSGSNPNPGAPRRAPRPPRIGELQDCGDPPAQTAATSFIFLWRWKFSLALAPHRHVLRRSPPFPGRGTNPCRGKVILEL